MNVLRILGAVLVCGLLSACGGGGGSSAAPTSNAGGPDGGAPAPGTPAPGATTPPPDTSTPGTSTPTTQVPGTFTLSATSAVFEVTQNGAAPQATSLAMQIVGPDVAAVGAAYVNGATQPAWLGIDITGSGTSYQVVLSVRSTDLQPGNYTSTFRVGTANARGDILQSQPVAVSYTVNAPSNPPAPGMFSLSATTASFASTRNASAPRNVVLEMTNVGPGVASVIATYAAGQSQPAWLGIDINPSVNGYSIALSIRSTDLSAGVYTIDFAISTRNAAGAEMHAKNVHVDFVVDEGAFTLSSASVSFSAIHGLDLPGASQVRVDVTGPNVASVVVSPTTGVSQWLNVRTTGSGSSYVIDLAPTTTSLYGSSYAAALDVTTRNAAGRVLQSRRVDVSYSILPRLMASSSNDSHQIIYGDVTMVQSHPVVVTAPGRSWRASSDSAWLSPSTATYAGNSTLSVAVDATNLAPGAYRGRITIANTANTRDSVTAEIAVQVQAPTLTVPPSILIGGADGRSAAAQPFTFSLSSGAATHPFEIRLATDDGLAWLDVSAINGQVGVSGRTLNVTGSTSGIPSGTHTGQLWVRTTVRDLVLEEVVPVTLNIEANRIVVSTAGVAFFSGPVPTRSVLTRNVRVLSSLARTDQPWEAQSDQSWLTVTASGVTGSELTLSANPAGLSADQVHFASVTVRSSDAAVENQETIRVGLYVSSTVPVNVSVPGSARFSTASPVEPLVFVNEGGPTIKAFNVYNGALVRTFNTVLATAGVMVMSEDGRRLYVYDTTNFRVSELDSVSGVLLRHYDSSPLNGTTPEGEALAYFRPAGHPILITPSSRMYDVNTNARYISSNFSAPLFSSSLDPADDGEHVVTEWGGVYRLFRSALNGGEMLASHVFSTGTARGASGQACISADRTLVYTASGAPYNFPGTSFATHQLARELPGSHYPNSILCLWNGLVVGGIDGYYQDSDIFVYDGATGQLLALLDSSGSLFYRSLAPRGMSASGDATRLITISTNVNRETEVRFQSLPAPH